MHRWAASDVRPERRCGSYAGQIGDDAARLANQKNTGRDVPRREPQLPEGVEPATRGVGQVERGRARAPDPGGSAGHALELTEKFRKMPDLLERKSRADQCALRIGLD